MTKLELIMTVSELTGLTKKQSKNAVNMVFENIQTALSKGDKVQIVGFGTFDVRIRPAHQGRNPQTGEAVQILQTKVPYFKAGKTLKEAIR